jgi:hypothetical protein
MLLLGLGCSGDGGGVASLDAIAGGWSNEAARRFVCITRDGRMWLGDSASDLDGPNPCTVADSGSAFHCSLGEDQSAFDGDVNASGDELTLEIVPCPSEAAECRATYARDSTVSCD